MGGRALKIFQLADAFFSNNIDYKGEFVGCKDNVKHCIPGKRMGMNIECEGGDGRRSSCQGNHSSHFVFYSKNVRLSAREWAFILILTKVIFCKPSIQNCHFGTQTSLQYDPQNGIRKAISLKQMLSAYMDISQIMPAS